MAITIHKQVVQCLQDACQSSKITTGFLIGLSDDEGGFTVVASVKCKHSDKHDIDYVVQLAGGLSICGIFYTSDRKVTEEGCNEAINTRLFNPLIEKLDTDDFVVCHVQTGSCIVTEENFFLYSDMISPVRVKTIITGEDGNFLSQNIILRTRCCLPLSFTYESNKGCWKDNLHGEVESLTQRILSPQAVFHLQNSSVILCKDKLIGVSEESICYDLYGCLDSDGEFGKSKQKKGKLYSKKEILQLGLYFQMDSDSSETPSCAPIIQQKCEQFQAVEMTLSMDVITTVSPQFLTRGLSERVSECVVRQLRSMEDCICKHHKGDEFCIPDPYHFMPCGLETITSVVYPRDVPEANLEGDRRKLHETLCIPLDRPSFRKANVYLFPEDVAREGYLINPHVGLAPSGVKDSQMHLVQGKYSYHHYMQDRFDDNKWGCAYRSLQTLMSWFRFQGYTDLPIPTHNEIQQALVEVGDKEPNFIGSRKWIGSMEVSFVLDHIMGVTSRIMTVNSGAELSSKGRELALHFETQGTPIMIGGGVLAHTILGVDYSEVTGDIKFLILDPHYTGGEDLKVIQDKGWCGWKGPDFWDQTAHYNLCMPQRQNVF